MLFWSLFLKCNVNVFKKREIISYQILASTVYFVKKGLYLVSKHVCSNGSLYCIERINKVVKN